ncbi:hypothetical protein H4R26_003729 [Coemansia thaxteri]|uniref:Small ribosomal subunit protein mS41 n=1 Tax=Coemansia thaxteri TaxID=2663907 RepID=A0A9W8BCG5_9FUNG|nr:hypothetical protein H4R26_003729 [Coemansia thaxteri]
MSTEAASASIAPTIASTAARRVVAVPRPRAQFDTPESFLKAIGRGCEKYTEKFKDWDHLFKANTIVLKHELGIGPKQRKWILMWTNKFRLGINPYLIQTSKKHAMKRTERLARAKRRRQD